MQVRCEREAERKISCRCQKTKTKYISEKVRATKAQQQKK